MHELQEIIRIRQLLAGHLNFFIEESAAGGKAGPILRDRLQEISFNQATMTLLQDHASPTLRADFQTSCTGSDEINATKTAMALTHATYDPLRKSLFLMGLIMGTNPDMATVNALDVESKEMIVTSGFTLLHSLRDISANLTLLLPAESTPPDACDLMKREFAGDMIPTLQKAVPALAQKLGFDQTAITVLDNSAKASLNAGREHLNPLPADRWKAALQP